MANFVTILQNASLTNAQKTRLLDGFVYQNGYTDMVEGPEGLIANPETKQQAFSRIMTAFVKDSVKAYEASIAADQARIAKYEEVNGINL